MESFDLQLHGIINPFATTFGHFCNYLTSLLILVAMLQLSHNFPFF